MSIRKARVHAGMTQEELADALGVTNGTVSRWETGKISPSVSNLKRLSQSLGVSVGYLLDEDPPGTPQRATG